MIIRKRKNLTEESISRVRQKTRVCESSKDTDGHPCVGYKDGEEFVPNKETLDAFPNVYASCPSTMLTERIDEVESTVKFLNKSVCVQNIVIQDILWNDCK